MGPQGGASSSEASPDSIDCWNWYTKLGPFFSASSFDRNFRPNNNQTFIVYVKSTLVLYRKGLCRFFPVLGFALEEKLHGAKCCIYYGPEGVQDSAKSSPFTQFFRIDAVYAKHIKEFGEMCVVADTDNKMGRTKIDRRGKISLFVGYSTQHAGDVYRLLDPKTSRVIHSRDVKWIGKMWAEFYKIRMIERTSGYVDPDEDFQLEEEEDQDIDEEESEPEEDESDAIQVGQPQVQDPTETPVGVANDEPVASRTRNHFNR